MHGNSNRSSVVEGVGSNATSKSARETRGDEVELQGRAKGRRRGVQCGPWWERPMYIRSSQGRELEQECTRRYPSGFRQKGCQAQSGPNVKTGWNQHIVASQKKTAKNHDYTMNRIKPNLKPGKVHSVIHGQNFDADVGPGCSAYKQTKPGKNIGNGVKSGASLLRHIIRTPNASQPFVPLPHHLHALCMFSSILYPCGTAARILEKPSKIPSRRDLPDNRLSVAFNIRGSQECWKWTGEPAIVEGSNSTFQSTQFEPMLRMRDKARENRGTMPENASSMREFELMRVVI